jgi:hypothetical protein
MEPKYVSEENARIRRATWRDPLPYELDLPEFNAVWDCIKKWDIGLPFDILRGRQLYSGATGNHVVAILDALRGAGLIKKLEQPAEEGK